jgi:hypothetical protein
MPAVACFIAISPLGANAGQDTQKPAPPTAGTTPVVVEQVENGSTFGVEMKCAHVNDRDAVLPGGHAGALFENTLLIGGVGFRVIGAANGFEDQSQGLTGSATTRFGSGT